MIGYWASHEYKRRSVIKDVDEFVGWDELIRLCKKMKTPRDRALYEATYLTGGRISEVLQLTKNNFEVENDIVVVRRMPLLKKYHKTGSWIESIKEKPDNSLARLYIENQETGMWERKRYDTKKDEDYRTKFAFPINEPFVEDFLGWVNNSKNLLFPGYNGSIKRHRAYMILRKTGMYPHWFRAQRASCLASFYGFDLQKIMEWLTWDEVSTAKRYAKLGSVKLVEQMKGKDYG